MTSEYRSASAPVVPLPSSPAAPSPQGSTSSRRFGRRILFRGAGVAALAVVLPTATARRVLAAEPGAAPAGFELLGQAPDARAVADYGYGGVIHTLFPYGGRIYYGYGDYNINAGSRSGRHTNVSSVDPHGRFRTDLASYRTEEVNTFRSFGGDLFVPNIDPSSGAPRTNSYASNHGGTWEANAGVACEHLYDVCDSSVPGEYFLAGSSGDAARLWRSTDDGATWAEFHVEAEAADQVDGFERFYWLARLGDRIYLRGNLGQNRAKSAPMRWYDTRTGRWGKVPDAGLKTRWTVAWPGGWSGPLLVGDGTYRGSDVVTVGELAYFATAGDVYAFTGKRAERLAEARVVTVGDDGAAYVLNNSGVHRVEGTTLTTVLGQAGLTASAMTVSGGVVYLGGQSSEIWARAL